MDPLGVLREFNTSNKLQLVQQVSGNVQFGDRYNFPASTPVYKAAGAQAYYYTLQDVLFYLKSRHLKPQEYVMAASQAGVANINIVDRKKVLDVLDGLAALDPALLPPLSGAGPAPGAAVGAGGGAGAAGRPAAAAAVPGGEGPEPAAKRQRVAEDAEAVAMRGLMEQERQLRNRNTMLLAPNKDFRRVLEVVAGVRKQAAQQAAAARVAAAKAAPPPAGSSQGKAAQDGRGGSSRYGRDATADQLKAMAPGAGGALAINMYGTSGKAAAAPPPPSGAAGYVPVRKSGSAAAAAPPPPPPSSQAPPSQAGRDKDRGSGKAKGGRAAAVAAGGGGGGGKGEAKKGGVPIIIVPSGMTSLLNMYNAKAFLEEGRFMTAAQAQAAAGGAPRPSSLPITRTAHRPAPGVEYALTDRPPPPGSPDWDRVVAVVVQGAKWQFKDWPHKGAKEGDLVEAFSRVCGFYIHYADEKVGPPVCDWNVSLVPLHRENRHKDVTAMMGLFRHLDTFLQAKRSTLAY